jgi:hypothetical protein
VRRREFMGLVSSALAWPISARAQRPSPLTVGVLHPGEAAAMNMRIEGIREGLNTSGNPGHAAIQMVVRLKLRVSHRSYQHLRRSS